MEQTFSPKTKTLLFFNILSLLAFLFFIYVVVTQSAFIGLDEDLSKAMASVQKEYTTAWVLFLTNLNGVIGTGIFTVLFSLYLLKKKYYADLKFYLTSFFLASAVFEGIKFWIGRARPELKIIDELGYSFPSGHSTMSMTMALALYFIFSEKMQQVSHRRLLLLAVLLWPFMIVSTRLYLNVHWLSDTLAGMSLGVFCTTLMMMILRRDPNSI